MVKRYYDFIVSYSVTVFVCQTNCYLPPSIALKFHRIFIPSFIICVPTKFSLKELIEVILLPSDYYCLNVQLFVCSSPRCKLFVNKRVESPTWCYWHCRFGGAYDRRPPAFGMFISGINCLSRSFLYFNYVPDIHMIF